MDNFLFLNISAPSKLMCVCVYCDEEEKQISLTRKEKNEI